MLKHCDWFSKIETRSLSDILNVEIYEFKPDLDNNEIIAEWVEHFKQHYYTESELIKRIGSQKISREKYLQQFVLPSKGSIKAGDFTEILISDLLEKLLSVFICRERYFFKDNPNTSTFNIDITAHKFVSNYEQPNEKDILLLGEVKSALVVKNEKSSTTLLRAINDIEANFLNDTRIPLTLNALKIRRQLRTPGCSTDDIDRFLNKTDYIYQEKFYGVCVHSYHTWEDLVFQKLLEKDYTKFPGKDLQLLAIKGDSLMKLVNEIYEKSILKTT